MSFKFQGFLTFSPKPSQIIRPRFKAKKHTRTGLITCPLSAQALSLAFF
nr:MAG TPA: hypothetical protein [Caudoviricetes sp.]